MTELLALLFGREERSRRMENALAIWVSEDTGTLKQRNKVKKKNTRHCISGPHLS